MGRFTRQDLERSSAITDRLQELWTSPVAFGSLWHQGVLQTDGTRRKRYSALHNQIVEAALASNRTSTIVSRNHGKTTIFMDLAFHSKWRHPDKRIMYMSASTQLACEILGELKAATQGEVELIPADGISPALVLPFRDVPGFQSLLPVKPPPGSPPASFNTAGRRGTGREPCFFPSSIGSNKAGKHPTDIFVDDPANEKNSTTPVQREKVIHSMKQLEPILRDPNDGAIRHIGTPWAFQDVAAWLGANSEYGQLRFGCWDGVNPDTGLQDGNGPGRKDLGAPRDGAWPLCPEYMTGDELHEAFLTIDDYEFWAQQYLCTPVAASNALFTDELLSASTNRVSDPAALPPGLNILLWDPTSAADAKVGDWNGLTLWRVTTAERVIAACKDNPALAVPGLADLDPLDNIFFCLHAAEIRGAPGECQGLIEDLHAKHGLDQLWVEDKASCGGIFMWLGSHHDLKRIPRVPIKLGSHGASKDRRLQALQVGFKNNRVRLVSGAPGYDVLTQRLTEYPKSESDDLPDSAALLTWAGQRKGALPKITLDKGSDSYYNAAADPLSVHFKPQPPSNSW